MLGDSLLVAPVFSEEGGVTYYVPAGCWTNFFTGTAVVGPGWVHETYDFMSVPLLVRPNAVIALGSQANRPDYDYSDGVTLQLYQLADKTRIRTVIPSVAGEVAMTFWVERDGQKVSVTCEGTPKEWQLLFVGNNSVFSAEVANIEYQSTGVLVVPKPGSTQIQILLDNNS